MGVFDFFARAQAPPAPPAPKVERIDAPALREIGAPGTINSRGTILLSEEVNLKWQNTKERIRLIEEMRRTDGQVQASILCCRLPILASNWIVRPPEDPTSKQQEIADFVELNLHGMTTPWTEVLGQILTYLEFGYAVFEKVYKVGSDGKWHWKKWAPRHQSTISGWNVAADGGLESVTQWAWKKDKYQEIPLGIDRLLVFTNSKESANWEGTSILRSAFKHYYLKDKLYRIDAIAHERHGVGVPVVKMPEGSGDSDYEIAEEVLINLRSHEKGYIIEPPGFETRILEIGNQQRNPIDSIKHHDEKIATSVLAQFLNLGFSSSGSRSLGQSFSDFFLASLNTHTAYIAGIINRHAVKQLVDVNFGEQERYPEIKAVPVAGINFELYAKSMMMLGQNDMVIPDQRLLEHIATMFGLPRPEPNALEKRMEREVEKEAKLASLKAAAMPKPDPSGGKEKAASPKRSGAGSGGKKAAKKLPDSVEAVIGLQIKAMAESAAEDPMAKVRPRLEGTLATALWTESDKSGKREACDIAANEFSRRLATAVQLGNALGIAEKIALEEVEQSRWILAAVLPRPEQSPEEETDAAD